MEESVVLGNPILDGGGWSTVEASEETTATTETKNVKTYVVC